MKTHAASSSSIGMASQYANPLTNLEHSRLRRTTVNTYVIEIVDPDCYALMEIVSAPTNVDRETYCEQMVVPLLPAISKACGEKALILERGNTAE